MRQQEQELGDLTTVATTRLESICRSLFATTTSIELSRFWKGRCSAKACSVRWAQGLRKTVRAQDPRKSRSHPTGAKGRQEAVTARRPDPNA